MFWYCHQSHFRFDQSLLFSHAKSCDGSILCPWLLRGQSSMAQRCWRTGDGEGFTKDQTNLWRNDRFYCKEGGKHVTVQILKMAFVLYLCLIWCWILFKEGFTIGQLHDEVKKGNHFDIEAMEEKHFYIEVENICGCPVSYGVSSSSDNGWGGCKERDAGPPPALMVAAVYPQTDILGQGIRSFLQSSLVVSQN